MYLTNDSAHTEQMAAIFSRWGSIPCSRSRSCARAAMAAVRSEQSGR